jgi:hypothetical protein
MLQYGYAPSFTPGSNQLITALYADGIAAQGAATSSESAGGIVELGTALEAASSTDLGANRPTVLQTKNATDTPQSGCATGYTATAGAGCTVIAQLTGKLKQSWLNLAETFTWTGHHVFSSLFATSASSTSATTTNMHITSLTSELLKVDANGRVLEAVAGTDYAKEKYTFSTTTDITTAAGGFATSTSFVVPAGVMNASSTIHVTGNFQSSDTDTSGASCLFYLRTDTGTTIGVVSYRNFVTEDDVPGTAEMLVVMNNAVNAQKFTGWGMSISSTNQFLDADAEGTSAVDFSSAVGLVGVIQGGDGTSICEMHSLTIVVTP